MRGGVPVLRRSTTNGPSRRRSARRTEGGSPMRPPACCASPTWMRPARKVPAVRTTAGASKRSPVLVTAPRTAPPSITRSSTAAWNTVRFGCASTARRMKARYSARSAWQRVARTAGPLDALSRRHWMPAASAARAMTPPSASISRTRWPLPMPPIAGLQLIAPMVSMLWVSSSVRAPARAAASAASVPAWPPPITMTSWRWKS